MHAIKRNCKLIGNYNGIGGIVGLQIANSTVSNSYNTFQVEQTSVKSMLVGVKEENSTHSLCVSCKSDKTFLLQSAYNGRNRIVMGCPTLQSPNNIMNKLRPVGPKPFHYLFFSFGSFHE